MFNFLPASERKVWRERRVSASHYISRREFIRRSLARRRRVCAHRDAAWRRAAQHQEDGRARLPRPPAALLPRTASHWMVPLAAKARSFTRVFPASLPFKTIV
jgi:hypothetical protein